ncbi:MAG: FAD-dependent oxidoreductase [Acidimicrobiales bacterium]
MAEAEVDVAIIGAGIIGAAIAYEAAQRGLSVTIIDRESGPGQGSTSYSSAIIRFSYSTIDGVSLAWEGMHYWKNWAAYLGADESADLARFEQCGMAILSPGTGAHDERVRELWRGLSIPFELWDNAELQRRLPLLDVGRFGPPLSPEDDGFWADAKGTLTGAVYSKDAGYINDPQLAAANLYDAALRHGATARLKSTVTGFMTEGGTCRGITLADGTSVRAAPSSTPLAPILRRSMRWPVRRWQSTLGRCVKKCTTPGVAPFDYYEAGMNIADEDLGIYLRPEVGNIVVGSLNPPCDEREFIDPDDFNESITVEQFERALLRANRRVPDLGMPHRRVGIVGVYDVSDDWIPIYDKTDIDGYFVAIGTSGNQFKNAGVAGHLMAELIVATAEGHDHDADPLVINGRYTGLPIELATFRRNRPINVNSTMGVNG